MAVRVPIGSRKSPEGGGGCPCRVEEAAGGKGPSSSSPSLSFFALLRGQLLVPWCWRRKKKGKGTRGHFTCTGASDVVWTAKLAWHITKSGKYVSLSQ